MNLLHELDGAHGLLCNFSVSHDLSRSAARGYCKLLLGVQSCKQNVNRGTMALYRALKLADHDTDYTIPIQTEELLRVNSWCKNLAQHAKISSY